MYSLCCFTGYGGRDGGRDYGGRDNFSRGGRGGRGGRDSMGTSRRSEYRILVSGSFRVLDIAAVRYFAVCYLYAFCTGTRFWTQYVDIWTKIINNID